MGNKEQNSYSYPQGLWYRIGSTRHMKPAHGPRSAREHQETGCGIQEGKVFPGAAREFYILVSELFETGHQGWKYLGVWPGPALFVRPSFIHTDPDTVDP